MATSAQAHGHLSTGTLPPGAAAGESAPARRALPANKSKACLHQARPWPTCPSKAPREDKPGPAGGRPQRKGPAPGVSVLSAARQGLGSPGLLSAAAQPRGNISSLGSLWRVLTSKAGHRRKQQEAEAGAAECDSLDEAWPQQIRNSPSGGAQPLKEQP